MNDCQIKKISNGLANLFLIPLVLITLLGSAQLLLSNFQGLSVTAVILVDFIFLLILTYSISRSVRSQVNKYYYKLEKISHQYRSKILVILIIGTVVWQIAIVLLVSGESGWDPNAITRAAMGQLDAKFATEYFSAYPNTMLLLLLEHGLWLLSGQLSFGNFVMLLNFLNVILIDCAVVMMGKVVISWFGKSCVRLLYLLSWLSIVMAPWIAVPYSDTWAFFLTALIICLVDRQMTYQKPIRKYLVSLCLGISIIFSYLIKPSLIITGMALLIVLLLIWITNIKSFFNRSMLISFCFLFLGIGGGWMVNQIALENQNVVSVKPGKSHPLTHFMAMGMQGNGSFYGPDVDMDNKIKSPVTRKKANTRLIRKRLAAFNGLTNYEKFLVQKQINNTADGSFGWGQEGGFIRTFHADNGQLNRTIIRRLFAKNGVVEVNNYEYRLFGQVVWCVVLLSLFGTIAVTEWKVQFLKYALVGFMLFLLLFEGGRSRYVIQFLPLVLILASVGGYRMIAKYCSKVKLD